MRNPYSDLPDHAFWRRAVAGRPAEQVDPVTAPPFTIAATDRVATAGSCFAQHISRALVARGGSFLVTETGEGENYGVFPARFGNIYTVRQLRQLFERAYGLREPADRAWRRTDGALLDPFRPRIQAEGFDSMEALAADREWHLAAVREMFETCDVLIFTLGLTEAWVSTRDGAVFPFAPGAVGAEGDGGEPGYRFENFTVAEMADDLAAFTADLRSINPAVRMVLTVSPVPLIATYTDAHVLAATTYSKAALRVAAQMAADSDPLTAYFPSFEIVSGPQARGRFFAEDAREVTADGVALVMDIFARSFLREDAPRQAPAAQPAGAAAEPAMDARQQALDDLICDEDVLDL